MIDISIRRWSFRAIGISTAVLLLCAAPSARSQALHASDDPSVYLRSPPRSPPMSGDFKLVTIGDLLYSHPYAKNSDPKLQRVLRLIRSGDVTIANQEVIFFDPKTFMGSGYSQYGGVLAGDSALGRDEKAMGVDMVSVANNHGMDWGWQGLHDCLRLLDEAGITYAGAGRNLQDARAAAYLRTPKGVIALVSTTSTVNNPNAMANDARGGVPARPGISVLRVRVIHFVTASQMALIRRLATQLASPTEPAPAPNARVIRFEGKLYRLSEHAGLHYQMDPYDLTGLLKAVHDAKGLQYGGQPANFVAFTIHTHETATGFDDDSPQPPDFLVKLAHDVIDAGADIFVAGGIHDLRGIEIYKGHPIFYGVGSFFINAQGYMLQEGATDEFPPVMGQAQASQTKYPEGCRPVHPGGNPASWYDGLVEVTDFGHGRAEKVVLYPLNLGNTCNRLRRGIPHLADLADARRILTNLQSYSATFGTKMDIEGPVGVIRIP